MKKGTFLFVAKMSPKAVQAVQAAQKQFAMMGAKIEHPEKTLTDKK